MQLAEKTGAPMEASPVPYLGAAAVDPHLFDPTGKYKLVFKGAFAAVEVAISEGDGVKSESGAMVTMSSNVDLKAVVEGGVGSALMRCCCTGESFFLTHYSLLPGKGNRGDVLLAPSVPGEIVMLNVNGQQSWCIQPGSFLAADQAVTTGTKILNISQGCCGGSGFFVLETKGAGRLLMNTYGSIVRYDLQPGEERNIDNGFLVAWESSMPYEIKLAARGLKNTLFSEGFICRFTGPGTVYAQTRSIKGLANALIPYLPLNNSGGGSTNIDIDF